MSAAVALVALVVAVIAFVISAVILNYLIWRSARDDRRERRDAKRMLAHAERMAAHNGRPHTDAVLLGATRRDPDDGDRSRS